MATASQLSDCGSGLAGPNCSGPLDFLPCADGVTRLICVGSWRRAAPRRPRGAKTVALCRQGGTCSHLAPAVWGCTRMIALCTRKPISKMQLAPVLMYCCRPSRHLERNSP